MTIRELRRKYYEIRDFCMEQQIVWSEEVFDNKVKNYLITNKLEATPSNWVAAAEHIKLFLLKHAYRQIRQRSLMQDPKQFDDAAKKYLEKNNLRSTPVNWLTAARNVSFTCEKCWGSGTYPRKPGPDFKGKVGMCFRCQGAGKQNDEDRLRNITYDKYNAELFEVKQRITERSKLERLLEDEAPNSKGYKDITARIQQIDALDAEWHQRLESGIAAERHSMQQKPYEEYIKIRREWKRKKKEREKGSE